MSDLELSTTGLECPKCKRNTLLAVTTQFINEYNTIKIMVIYHCVNCNFRRDVELDR